MVPPGQGIGPGVPGGRQIIWPTINLLIHSGLAAINASTVVLNLLRYYEGITWPYLIGSPGQGPGVGGTGIHIICPIISLLGSTPGLAAMRASTVVLNLRARLK